MTGGELKAKAIKLYGERRWSSALATAIGRSRFQIWRYSKADHVPIVIALAVSSLRR